MGTGYVVGENALIGFHEDDIPLFSATAFDTKDGYVGYWKLQRDDGKLKHFSYRPSKMMKSQYVYEKIGLEMVNMNYVLS